MVEVFLKQQPTANQVHRGGAHSLQVVVKASVSLFNGQAGISEGYPHGFGCRERDIRAQQLIDLGGISNRFRAKVPSGRCRQRHCDFWITDTAKIVSVSIDLRHEMWKGRDLRTDRSRRSLNSPRIGHARKRRKSAALNRDQGFVAETRVLTERWWCAVGCPLVPCPQERPHDVAMRCRIVQ